MTTRTDRGWTLTAGALAAVAMSAIAVTAGGPIAQRADAAAPAIPNGCAGTLTPKDATANLSLAPTANPADDADPATPRTYLAGPVRTSTITVSGAQPYLRDVDLRTFITHEASRDVTISLTGPGPSPKTIVVNSGSLAKSERDTFNDNGPGTADDTGYTRNGGPNNNQWNGTRWDDQGGIPVNDFAFPGVDDGVSITPLIEPEGSLGAFIGINPNGVWTLSVQNAKPFYPTSFVPQTVPPTVPPPNPVEAPDTGNFASWGLDLSTLAAAPGTTTSSFSNNTVVDVPDNNPAGVTQTINVAGVPAGQSLVDIDLLAKLPQTSSSDLEVTLTSPSGTGVTIATDPGRDETPGGSFLLNLVADTRWDDSATEGVTDAIFTSGVNKTALQPEEALAAFAGENPNGPWTLKVVDDGPGDVGKIAGATIELKTTAGCGVVTTPVVPPVTTPPVNTPPRPPVTTTPPPVTTQAITLGLTGKAKRSVRFGTKAASVKLTLNRAATITAVLKRGKKTLKTVVKPGLVGSNTVSVKLPKKAGKYSLKVTASATGVTSISKTITLIIKAKPKA